MIFKIHAYDMLILYNILFTYISTYKTIKFFIHNWKNFLICRVVYIKLNETFYKHNASSTFQVNMFVSSTFVQIAVVCCRTKCTKCTKCTKSTKWE